jgi:hypothetical protein
VRVVEEFVYGDEDVEGVVGFELSGFDVEFFGFVVTYRTELEEIGRKRGGIERLIDAPTTRVSFGSSS